MEDFITWKHDLFVIRYDSQNFREYYKNLPSMKLVIIRDKQVVFLIV